MLMVYGAYGYTGRLVVERALAGGIDVLVAGRDAAAVEAIATEADRDLPARTFTLDHDRVVRERVAEVEAVLNCAGPFRTTVDPLVSACLDVGTDYLDVTGEIRAFEILFEYAGAAARRDVTVLPGVGFDVVPTDCLAAHLAGRFDGDRTAATLSLAVATGGGLSGGTLRTIADRLGEGGAVRRDGRIERVPLGHQARGVDFDDGRAMRRVAAVPWGDLATAERTTDVPNVITYAALPGIVIDLLVAGGGTLLERRPVRTLLRTLAARVDGPDATTRRTATAHVWGELAGPDGERLVARLHTPDPYVLTARTAVESARRVLDGAVTAGVHTPAEAFGPDYPLSFDGVERDPAAHPSSGSRAGSDAPDASVAGSSAAGSAAATSGEAADDPSSS